MLKKLFIFKDKNEMIQTSAMIMDNHCHRVGLLLEKFGFYGGFLRNENLYEIGVLHDIGKLMIPEIILNGKGELTESNRELLQEHPEMGRNILMENGYSIDSLEVQGALYHHEKWDGSGYPYNKQKEDIPFIARAIALCDITDAMMSNRSYQKGQNDIEIKLKLQEVSDSFDPNLKNIYFKYYDNIVLPIRRQYEKTHIQNHFNY